MLNVVYTLYQPAYMCMLIAGIVITYTIHHVNILAKCLIKIFKKIFLKGIELNRYKKYRDKLDKLAEQI